MALGKLMMVFAFLALIIMITAIELITCRYAPGRVLMARSDRPALDLRSLLSPEICKQYGSDQIHCGF